MLKDLLIAAQTRRKPSGNRYSQLRNGLSAQFLSRDRKGTRCERRPLSNQNLALRQGQASADREAKGKIPWEEAVHDPQELRSLARRCRTMTQTCLKPSVNKQLWLWAVELECEADTIERRSDRASFSHSDPARSATPGLRTTERKR